MKILILFFISLLNIILWFVDIQSITEVSFYLPLFSIVISVIFLWPEIHNKRIEFKIIYFLLAGILFYNTPLYFKSIFNPNIVYEHLLYYGIKEIYFIKSNILLGISLPLIVAGYLTGLKKKLKPINMKKEQISNKEITVFSLLGFVFLILSIRNTGLTIGSTYIGVSSYYYVLLVRMIYLLGILMIYRKIFNNRINKSLIQKEDIIPLILFLLFVLYILIGGDRGPVFTILLILFFGFVASKGMAIKLKTTGVIILIAILFYSLFTFIEVLRLSDFESPNIEALESAYYYYQTYETVSGLQLRTTALAIEGIQTNQYDHTYGMFTIQSLVKSIPFIGNNIIRAFIDDNSIFANGSARLLTIQNSGVNYTSGLGTTYLADLFIEFGLIGIIVFSFLYGILVGVFDNKIKNKSFRGFVDFMLIAYFVAFSFYVGRSTIIGFLVYFIHSWFIYMFIKMFFIRPFRNKLMYTTK